jgi:hypothetical protein
MTNRRFSQARNKVSLYLMMAAPLAFFGGLIFENHVVTALALPILIAGVFIGKNRLVCPKCGKRFLAIGVDARHCHGCGADYFEAPSQSNDA